MAINLNKKQTGSGFVNLNKYLDANKQNKLGQTIASGLTGEAGQLKQDTQKEAQSFQQKSEAGRLGTAANVAQRQNVLDKTANLQNIGELQDQDVSQFNTYLSGDYKGPTALSNQDTLASRANELASLGKGGQGNFNLLQKYIAQPSYTAGQQRLDNLLVGRNNQPLKEARRTALSTNLQTNQEIQNAQNMATGIAGQNKAFGEETGKQIGSLKSNIEGDIKSKYDTEVGRQAALYDLVNSKLASGEKLTNEERDLLGLNAGTIQNRMAGLPGMQQQTPLDIYNLDATKYLSKQDLSQGAVASDAQKARLMALSKLAQKAAPSDFTSIDTGTTAYDPNKLINLNVNKLKSDADIVKQQYQSELNRGLGLNLGPQLEDKPNSVLGLIGDAAGTMTAGIGHIADIAMPSADGFNLYEFADTLGGMPDISNMNYQQALNAVNAYEAKISPFKRYVEQGRTESKTKYNNLQGAYNTIVPRLNAIKQHLADYKANLDKSYGVGRQI